MLPPNSEQPIFLIVAGPNGSGKSSVYANSDLEMGGRTVWIVNPDLLAARISLVEHRALPDANLIAVQRIESWVSASIAVHKTIGVETVLSTDKYRRLVEAAKALGFAVWLMYVVLDSPERSIERIKLRVAKGVTTFRTTGCASVTPGPWRSCLGFWSKRTRPGSGTTAAPHPGRSGKSSKVSSRSTRMRLG